MGMYIDCGRLAFFRKYETPECTEDWECTGYVITFDWSEVRILLPSSSGRLTNHVHVGNESSVSSPCRKFALLAFWTSRKLA